MAGDGESMRARILESKVAHLEIDLGDRGRLRLRGITLNDSDWLLKLPEKGLSPREAALTIIGHQRTKATPPPNEVAGLSDGALARVLTVVTAEGLGEEVDPPADLRSAYEALLHETVERRQEFEEIGRRLTQALAPTLLQIQRTNEMISSTFGEAIRSISTHVTQVSRAFEQAFDFREAFRLRVPDMQRVFNSLPDMSVMRQALQETDAGQIALEEVGYGFNLDVWSLRFVRKIGRGGMTRRQIQNAVREFSRSGTFRADLEELFTSSSVLKRRWVVIDLAIAAHHRREYALSIPALLPQLEGVITDLLILKGEAVQQGSRIFKKEDGRIKLTGAGKPDELRGLHPKTSHVTPSPEAAAGANLILSEIAPARNSILHGARPSYPSAQLSVQLLLLLSLYGQVAAAAE